jgi:hypothetical protein
MGTGWTTLPDVRWRLFTNVGPHATRHTTTAIGTTLAKDSLSPHARTPSPVTVVLQARRAASEYYVFSKAHKTDELKAEVDVTRAQNAIDLGGKANEIETTVASLLTKLPVVDLESVTFLHKVRGDFYAFWARVELGDSRKSAVESARAAYTQALSGPEERNATRLGAIFSRAVFEADICGDIKTALALVRTLPPKGDAVLTTEHDADCAKISALLTEGDIRWSAPPPSEASADGATASVPPKV